MVLTVVQVREPRCWTRTGSAIATWTARSLHDTRFQMAEQFYICYRQLGETALAEEATQDIFIKIYTSVHNFRKEAKFSTWLYRIATNHCINLNNRHHRRHRGQQQSFDEMHNPPSDQETPLQQLEKRNFEEQLQEALHKLPDEHRVLLILRDIQDCSYEEIAEITQLNVGTIKSRIHRGRSNLRQILSGANRHE